MQEPTKKQIIQIEKLAKFADGGFTSLIDFIVEIEDRIDTEIPELKDLIDKVKENTISREEIKSLIDIVSLQIPEKGDKGDKGDKGEKGDKGDKGDRGLDGKDGKNGIDGLDGKDGKDFTPDLEKLAINTINILESFTGDKRLDAKAIKNLPESVTHIVEQGGYNIGGYETPIKAGSNINVTKDVSGAYIISSDVILKPADGNMAIQFNDNGAFGGNQNFIYDKTLYRQTISGTLPTFYVVDTSGGPTTAQGVYLDSGNLISGAFGLYGATGDDIIAQYRPGGYEYTYANGDLTLDPQYATFFVDTKINGKLAILEGGVAQTYYTFFQGGDQSANITYTLPTALPASNKVLQSDSSGVLSWVSAGGGGGATTALDNLASVAINTSLLPGTTNSIDLGSSTKAWKSLYLSSLTSGRVPYIGTGGLLKDESKFLYFDTYHQMTVGGARVSTVFEGVNEAGLQIVATSFPALTLKNSSKQWDIAGHTNGVRWYDGTAYQFTFESGKLSIGAGKVSPINALEVTGACLIGTGASWINTVTAPTGGLAVEGNVMIGSVSGTSGANKFLYIYDSGSAGITFENSGGKWSYFTQATTGNYGIYNHGLTAYAMMVNSSNNNVGFYVGNPTAKVHIQAGTATAGTAPLKFTAGTLMTTPELGAMEFVDNGTTGHLYITLNVAGVLTRLQII